MGCCPSVSSPSSPSRCRLYAASSRRWPRHRAWPEKAQALRQLS